MPAIDLALWRRQARLLAKRLDDPPAFIALLHHHLEAQAHRLLHRGRSLARQGALAAYDVPPAMLNELEAVLVPAASASPEAAIRLADSLWAQSHLEEKLLALTLVGSVSQLEAVRGRISRWVLDLDDPRLLESLAQRGTRLMRESQPALFSADLAGWLSSRKASLRRLGWMALAAWLQDQPSQAALAALDLLRHAFREEDPEALRRSHEAFSLLAQSHPAEVLSWLADLPSQDVRVVGRRWLRAALPFLPPEVAASVGTLLASPEER